MIVFANKYKLIIATIIAMLLILILSGKFFNHDIFSFCSITELITFIFSINRMNKYRSNFDVKIEILQLMLIPVVLLITVISNILFN